MLELFSASININIVITTKVICYFRTDKIVIIINYKMFSITIPNLAPGCLRRRTQRTQNGLTLHPYLFPTVLLNPLYKSCTLRGIESTIKPPIDNVCNKVVSPSSQVQGCVQYVSQTVHIRCTIWVTYAAQYRSHTLHNIGHIRCTI